MNFESKKSSEQNEKTEYRQFLSKISESVEGREDMVLENCGTLNYQKDGEESEYEFLKIRSGEIKPDDKILLIRAGIHGDEVAGPLTLMNHLREIFDYAGKKNVKLVVYPLGNPSGFANGIRYNIEGDKGEGGNNDFMRYELEDGKIVDDLGTGKDFKKWYWASDPKFEIKLPKETQIMHQELKKLPLNQIVGVIDLHQDYLMQNAFPSAYHYSFGDLNVYDEIIDKIEQIVPILKNTDTNTGFMVQLGKAGEVISSEGEAVKSDERGFVVRHDCTLPDLLYRLGIKYCMTVETTGITPKDIADKVNLIWIYGIIDLISKGAK